MLALAPSKPARRPPPAPPKHLGASGRGLWRAVVTGFAVDEPHRRVVLTVAAECMDLIAAAQAEIAEHGLVTDGGRYGRKVNPAVAIDRDQKRLLLTALSMLDLDLTAANLVVARADRA